LIVTATKPCLKATPPHTTKVLAENIVMNALRPLHHGDCSPAAKNEEFFTNLPNNTPMRTVPPRYMNKTD
jgi:hypothetical protein